MKRRRLYPFTKSLVAAAVSLSFLFAGCLQKSNSPTVVRFAGQTITEAEYKTKVQSLPREIQNVVLRDKKRFAEDMAVERLLIAEAKKKGIEVLPDVQDLLRAAKNKILVAKLIELEIDKKLTLDPDEAQRYYEAHKQEFMTPLLLRASHILVKTEEEAKQIKKELSEGADFEDTARRKSIDTTAMRGGDLGFFQKGQLVSDFETAAFQMKKGQISDVVKTQFGYHVVKLTDRMEPTLRDFRSVKDVLAERLLKEKRSSAFKVYVEKIKSGTRIQIDEKALDSVKL